MNHSTCFSFPSRLHFLHILSPIQVHCQGHTPDFVLMRNSILNILIFITSPNPPPPPPCAVILILPQFFHFLHIPFILLCLHCLLTCHCLHSLCQCSHLLLLESPGKTPTLSVLYIPLTFPVFVPKQLNITAKNFIKITPLIL